MKSKIGLQSFLNIFAFAGRRDIISKLQNQNLKIIPKTKLLPFQKLFHNSGMITANISEKLSSI